jgi:hypothetical protein
MKLNECTICWTPNRAEFPSGMRGKVRLFATTAGASEMAVFPCRVRHTEARANDPRREIREAYALGIAFILYERDRLDVSYVHQTMLAIEEYRSGCASELLTEGAPP